MKDYSILVACPSVGRADSCTTHKVIDEVVYFVDESEVEAYRKTWSNVVAVPAGVNVRPSGKCRTLNWILDNYSSEFDIIYFTDDDIYKFGRIDFLDENKPIDSDWEHTKNVVFQLKEIADKIGAKIGGFSCLSDCHDRINAGGTSGYKLVQKKYIDGKAFIIFSDDGTRYDEELFLKEDIDFNCQSLLKNKRTLSAPFVVVCGKALKNKGGVCDIRTMQKEIEHARKLIYKAGDMVSPIIPRKITKGVRSQAVQMKIRNY